MLHLIVDSRFSVFFIFMLTGNMAQAGTSWDCHAQGKTWQCTQINIAQRTQDIAKQLNWVEAKPTAPFCSGHYQDPDLFSAPVKNKPWSPTTLIVQADHSSVPLHGGWAAAGHVKIKRPGQQIETDHLQVSLDPQHNRPQQFNLYGGVTLREPNKLVLSEQAQLDLMHQTGYFFNNLYRLGLYDVTHHGFSSTQPSDPKQRNAWGHAKLFYQIKPKVFELRDATYTTCPPNESNWHLEAKRIRLNKKTGRGESWLSTLYFKKMPIFEVPYFNFPIDNRRKTGFLIPSVGSSSGDGLRLSLPYYFNLAPNYDLTLYPKFLSRRGLLLGSEFRYLTDQSNGSLFAQGIANDPLFSDFKAAQRTQFPNSSSRASLNGSNSRYAVRWKQKYRVNSNWTSSIDYQTVSDAYYLRNYPLSFSTSPSSSDQLSQKAELNYDDSLWKFSGKLQRYQNWVPSDEASTQRSYNTLPELNLRRQFSDDGMGLRYDLFTQLVNFTRPQINPPDSSKPTQGRRFHIQPEIAWPIQRTYGFFTPRLRLLETYYDLDRTDGLSEHFNRALPIYQLDTGLFFDRSFQLQSKRYQQSLEPHLQYLYVPYHNQNDIPVFRYRTSDYNFAPLFAYNRFNDLDRIGDTQQVSLGLSSNFINTEDGFSLAKFSIGQAYHYGQHRVTTCNTPGCTSLPATNLEEKDQWHAGSFSANMSYTPTQTWSMNTSLGWDPSIDKLANGKASLRYYLDQQHIANLSYHYQRGADPFPDAINGSNKNDLQRVDASFVWPINPRWLGLASWNRNISHGFTQDYLLGMEYNSCCWALRFVTGRRFVALTRDSNQSSLYSPRYRYVALLQWQLKGLGNFATGTGASSPRPLFASTIPRYQGNFVED